jgi:hypothetical protein
MRQFPAWAFWGMTLVAALLAVALRVVWGELKEARLQERSVREERDAAVEEATRLKKEQQTAIEKEQAAIDAAEQAYKSAK